MNWYLEVLKKYAVFNGRARRTEYWMYTLFNIIAYIILLVLVKASGDSLRGVFMALYSIYSLGVLCPSVNSNCKCTTESL